MANIAAGFLGHGRSLGSTLAEASQCPRPFDFVESVFEMAQAIDPLMIPY